MAYFWQVSCTWQMSSYTAAPCNDLCTQPNSSLISKTFHYQPVGPSSQHCWFLSAQQKCCRSQEHPVGDCLAREGTWHSVKPTYSRGTWGTCSHISWILLSALFSEKVVEQLVRFFFLPIFHFSSLLHLLFTSWKPPSRVLTPVFLCGEYQLRVRSSVLTGEHGNKNRKILQCSASPAGKQSLYFM